MAASSELAAQVRRGLGWSILSSLTLRLGSLVLGMVLARLLVPEQFGVYAVALAVQAVLITLADLGLSADLIRSDDPGRRAPTVATLGLVSGASLALVMVLSADLVARTFGSPDSASVIAALSLTLVLAGAGVVPYAALQRRFAQRTIFVIAGIDFVIATGVTLVLITAGWGVMALAAGRIVAQLVTVVLQFRLSHTRPRIGVDRRVVGSVLVFGAPVAGANMLSWALLNIDNLAVARLAGPVALGFYVLAFNVSTWPMSAIGQAVRAVALPAFARLPTGATQRDPSLGRAAGVAWAGALPAGVALAVLAVPLVTLLYGTTWRPAAPVLAALGLFGALRVLFDLMACYLLARGRSGSVLGLQVLWVVALVPALVVGTRTGGIAGAGWAHLVVATSVVLPAYVVAVGRAGADLRALAGSSWPPVLAVLPAAGVGLLAADRIETSAAAVIGGALAGGVVYAALLWRWVARSLRAVGAVLDADTEAPAEPVLAPVDDPTLDLPTVTVVVPCFDYARYLPTAVDSVLTQTGVLVDVVIVDDASTDDSARVARELAEHDARVRVLSHPTNMGPVSTFNDGLAVATGEFLVRLDADDLLTPGSLARSVALCRRFPEVGLVYGHPLHFHDAVPTARIRATRWTRWSGESWLEDRCRSGVNVITSPEALVRTSVLRRVGGQRELAHTHDMEWWMRIAAVSDVGYIQGADQAWHREHPRSLSLRADDALGVGLLHERRLAFEALTVGLDARGDHERLRELACRTLATEALRRACYEYDRRRAPRRDVAALVAFALAADPGVVRGSQWHLLTRQGAAGAAWTRWRPWRRLCVVRRVIRDHVGDRRWRRTGVYSRLAPASSVAPCPTGPLLGGRSSPAHDVEHIWTADQPEGVRL